MTKSELIAQINAYKPFDAAEAGHKAATLALLHKTDHCFQRSDFPGHMVGGAWLLSPDGKRVLLARHKYLDRWLQFGGHADGEVDLRNVALREAREESGITQIDFVTQDLFDIDAHLIPANPKKAEPEHWHYELRYLLRAGHEDTAQAESSSRWFTADELTGMPCDASIRRMIAKWSRGLY